MMILLVNRVGDTGYRFRAMYGQCARCLMKVKIEAFQAFGGGKLYPWLILRIALAGKVRVE